MIVSKRIALIIPVVIVALGAISLAYAYDIQKQNCEKYRKYIERIVITGSFSPARNTIGTLTSQVDSGSKSTNPIPLTHNSAHNELINQYDIGAQAAVSIQ
jgi:hypothetical protein